MHTARAAIAFGSLFFASCGPIAAPSSLAPPPPAMSEYHRDKGFDGASKIDFDLTAAGGFYSRPWPSELARKDGRPSFDNYPGKEAPIFDRYVETAKTDIDGYSLAPVAYFHLSGAVDPKAFNVDPKSTMQASSPFLLVDVDPASPERGKLRPIELRYVDKDLRYVPKGVLAMKPFPGFVLRSNTLYAAVVRRGALGLGTPDVLERLKSTSALTDGAEEAARKLHAPAFDELTALGLPREDVASIALFRTGSPEKVTRALIEEADALPSKILDAQWDDALEGGNYFVLTGHYCTPNIQSKTENAPYVSDAGGTVELDASGKPRTLPIAGADAACGGAIKARYVLSIPKSPMPAGGFPLLVTAHGTGGNAETFLGGVDFAGWAASEGIAAISTDQPLHGGFAGGRPGAAAKLTFSIAGFPIPIGAGVELAFYNPFFPATARDNLRQATLDAAMLIRAFAGFDFARIQGLDKRGSTVPKIDRERIVIAGHSQGSQSMAALGALDPRVRGVLLSGCGGDARLGILLRQDLEVMPIIGALLGVFPGELDAFHPMMALVQNLADPIDPQTYARFYWDPLPGRRPQNVLHFSGIKDTYTPHLTAEALAAALLATPIDPLVQPVPSLDLLNLAPPAEITRGFAQYDSTKRENGHFVLYHEPGASDHARQLFRAALGGPVHFERNHAR